MKITYIYPPLSESFYPLATRMITENLLRDERLEVEFSDIPVKTFSEDIYNPLYDDIILNAPSKFPSNIVSFLKRKYVKNVMFYIFMTHGYFNSNLFKDFDSEYVVVTCISFCDLIIVKHLLKNNKKVVIGGPLINIQLSPTFIRDLLQKMGIEQTKLNDNLIVVSGNIDLSTDLYSIIRQFKDTTISYNEYNTLFQCERDFLQEYYDDSALIPVHLGFNNRCWHGKCKFCTYKNIPKMEFLKDAEDDKVVGYIHNVLKRFKSNKIRFVDSYYHAYTPRVKQIFEAIKEYDMTIYSGILLLKDRDYIDFVNRYVNRLLIGLESTSDFSLKYVNKGYTHQDIEVAIDHIINYLDRDIFLEISVILDLPSKDDNDVKRNYRDLYDMKQRLVQAGFKVGIHMNILSILPNLELLSLDNGFLKRSDDKSKMDISSGKNFLNHLLRQAGMDRPSLLPSDCFILDQYSRDLHYGFISSDIPVIRYDIHDNVLPSDLHLMDEGLTYDILKRN